MSPSNFALTENPVCCRQLKQNIITNAESSVLFGTNVLSGAGSRNKNNKPYKQQRYLIEEGNHNNGSTIPAVIFQSIK